VPETVGRHPWTGHLVLQRKRPDCGTTSPIIAALCQVGGQNANRRSEVNAAAAIMLLIIVKAP